MIYSGPMFGFRVLRPGPGFSSSCGPARRRAPLGFAHGAPKKASYSRFFFRSPILEPDGTPF